jgi:hypothetical protein
MASIETSRGHIDLAKGAIKSHLNPFCSLMNGDLPGIVGMRGELQRQKAKIAMIASENIGSRAVLHAQAAVQASQYAEGYQANKPL